MKSITWLSMFIGLTVLNSTICLSQDGFAKSSNVIICGEVNGGEYGQDSIRIEYQSNIIFDLMPGIVTNSTVFYIKANSDGKFKVKLPSPNSIGEVTIDLFGYQSNLKKLGRNPYNPLLRPMFRSFFVESGDSVNFSILNYKDTRDPVYSISGIGSAKYQAMKDISSSSELIPAFEPYDSPKEYLSTLNRAVNVQRNIQASLLNWYKPKISKSVFNLMNAEITCSANLYLTKILYGYNNMNNRYIIKDLFLNFCPKTDTSASSLSTRNLHFLILKEVLELNIKNKNYLNKHNMKEVYLSLKNNFSGLLRDKLISNFLLNEGWRTMEIIDENRNEYNDCLQDCYETLQNEDLKSEIFNRLKRVKRGVAAYNFILPDTSGKLIKLDTYKGKVILLDIYTTICTSCRVFSKTLKDEVFPVFKGNPDVIFMAVSIEPNKQKWLKDIHDGHNTDKMHEKIMYTEGLGLNHPMMKYYGTNSMPLLLLIDKNGNIANSSFDNLLPKSSGEEIVKMINELVNVRHSR